MSRSLLKPRTNLLPEEYPELHVYRKAINDCMWFHDKWTFNSDKNDYNNQMSSEERSITKKGLMAISQIEVKVKRMWADIFHIFQKPEIDAVGITFAESEVRHQLAYRRLLEELNLQTEFDNLENIPCIKNRVDYLVKYLNNIKDQDHSKYIITLTLFSLFIENSSLFGQFAIFKKINQKTGYLKDTDNVIMDTTKEENIHALFGVHVIKILKEENPELFTEDFESIIINACLKSFEAESNIIDWIFSEGELDYLSKKEVKEYIKYRLNYSISLLNHTPEGEIPLFNIKLPFEINEDLTESFEFFEVEQSSTVHVDFFHKKNPNYSKFSRTASADDLF